MPLTVSGLQSLPPELKQMLYQYLVNENLQSPEAAQRLNALLAPYGISIPEPEKGSVLDDLLITALAIGGGYAGFRLGLPLIRSFFQKIGVRKLLQGAGEAAAGAAAAEGASTATKK